MITMKLLTFMLLIAVFSPSHQRQAASNVVVCVSAEEKMLYELISEYRKKKKLSVIPLSSKLSLVAQTHAKDLVDNYKFDPSNTCNPHSWSEHGKWTSCCYTAD